MAFLEQAAKCLRGRGADPKLQEALQRAQGQKKTEDERAAKAAAEAAAAKERAPMDTDPSGARKRRAEEEVKSELLEFPQGATEQQLRQIAQEGGCTKEHIDKHAIHILPLLAALEPGRALGINMKIWAAPSRS